MSAPWNGDPFEGGWEKLHNHEIWGVVPIHYPRTREVVTRESIATRKRDLLIHHNGEKLSPLYVNPLPSIGALNERTK